MGTKRVGEGGGGEETGNADVSWLPTYFSFQQLVIGGITGGCWSWDIPSRIQFNAQSWRKTFFL